MKECLNFSLSVYGKQCNITLIYLSPSQSSEEFDTFLSNFEFLLDYIANPNPFVSIIIGAFNARSNNWCFSDKTTYEGKKLESLISQCGFKQVISDPTHIYHQLIHAKFNLKIFYAPPYERVVWHYQDANNGLYPNSTGKELFLISKFRFLMKLFLIP